MSTTFDKELDARGLNCPLPILRTKKSLSDMSTGQVLKILATDPGSSKDFQAFLDADPIRKEALYSEICDSLIMKYQSEFDPEDVSIMAATEDE